ncbi:MAG: PBP1A family penicillin-binding protein [Alphaproteobacteria bacterium]|nr:PBP1A family penicillin-binding protein [Alphaproteobacteria bacterium]
MSQSPSPETQTPPSRLGRWLYWGLVGAIWATIGVAVLVFIYALDLPDTDELWKIGPKAELSLYAAEDELIARRGRRGGQPLQYKDFPPALVQAVTAIEDRRFFSHFGLDPRGLLRALTANIWAGRTVQGGSTLTQQLAKNVFLTPERTYKRKIQELLLAFWLEAQFTKQDLLALYLNRVYFGAGAYGVQAAAETYFNRPVQSLSLGEAAMLAGLLKAPSRYAPTRNPEAARARAMVVLGAMREVGHISEAQAVAVAGEPVSIVNRSSDAAHYAVDWTLDQLPDFVGRPRADLDIITTLDPRLQLAAERSIKSVLNQYGDARNASQAAMVVMSPDGAIRAMVGGKSYAQSTFNRATMAKRQPGSSFKPIVYLAALENGLTPSQIYEDAPISVGQWQPRNYTQKYLGAISAQTALAKSINTVAVQVSEETGREKVIDMARRLGIRARLRPHPSLALGAFEVTLLELTAAYAHFANGGKQTLPHIISEVITSSGQVLYQRNAPKALPVVAPHHIGTLNEMLRSAVTQGTGQRAQIKNLDIAGKTGTSQNWRDAWFVGYTGALVVGVWVGNDDNSAMARVSGGGLPAQIWRDFMVGQKSLSAEVVLPGGEAPKGVLRGLLRRFFGG